MSRIESRPTKRALGEYLFFIDVEASANDQATQNAFKKIATYTEIFKVFGSYTVLQITDVLEGNSSI